MRDLEALACNGRAGRFAGGQSPGDAVKAVERNSLKCVGCHFLHVNKCIVNLSVHVFFTIKI